MMLKFIGQCDVKHIMTLPIKIMTSVLKVSIDITSMEAHLIGLAAILVIMYVSNLTTDVILCVL